jgi:hypothetical protein
MLREGWLALPLHGVRGPTHGVEPSSKTLTTDHFVRVDPPFSGGTIESDWIPDVAAG